MSVVRPIDPVEVRSSVCRHGRFFSSRAAASDWVGEHPVGEVYPVRAAFRLDRQVVEQLSWDAQTAATERTEVLGS